jgi:sulfite reductase (NADPH) flavoprotein alpha-component
MNVQLVPESAPFTPEQRAWLNGFLSGVLGVLDQQPLATARDGGTASPAAAAALHPSIPGVPPGTTTENEVFPWHDPGLPLNDRMTLAEGRPKERRLMAAMAQLDCGSCGYLCKTYAEAIASGTEKNTTLCSPGGSETAKMLRQILKEPASAVPIPTTSNETNSKHVGDEPGTRSNPVTATLLASQPLNKAGSAKDTRHVVIDLSHTTLKYQVGDALGVYPTNCNDLIDRFVGAANLDANAVVGVDGKSMPMKSALAQRCLRSIPVELVEAAIQLVDARPKQNGQVRADANTAAELRAFEDSDRFDQWDCIEFFEAFSPLALSPQQIIDCLQPLRPRLYSIASSQSQYPTQVHLTVGRVENEVRSRLRKGVASTMFSDRLDVGDSVQVFVHKSHGFTIPSDPHAPMIMVGPGTGIAPFLAFLQQRDADKSKGKNWLFFGDQRKDCDFLYEEQLELWRDSGLLTRLDLAFSRDSAEKVYVQHRMKENGAELYAWLESGAYFFVCGDASRMAVDVDRALQEVIAKHGNRTLEEAKDYVSKLSQQKRYVRDVY